MGGDETEKGRCCRALAATDCWQPHGSAEIANGAWAEISKDRKCVTGRHKVEGWQGRRRSFDLVEGLLQTVIAPYGCESKW